jgi:hypothetical protein
MRLYLINPSNPLVCLTHVKDSRWNRYRTWKPLGLFTLAALTPAEWQVTIFDENIRTPEYEKLPRADLPREMETCDGTFYSLRNILRRAWGSLCHRRQPLIAIVANLSYRKNLRQSQKSCGDFLAARGYLAGDDGRPNLRSELFRVLHSARTPSQPRVADA